MKTVFYKEFDDIKGVIYDAEENSGSFVDFKDIIEELEEKDEKEEKEDEKEKEKEKSVE